MDKKIFFDKLFPWKQGVNRYNLHMEHECISYITLPKDSIRIAYLIIQKMNKYNKKPQDITIIDATACVGGDTIRFCDIFGIVIPIEINEQRYSDLVHNIKTYNIQNAYPIMGNCLEKIPDIRINSDIVFVDPPWGGNSYKQFDKLTLKLGDKDLDEVIKFLLEYVKLVVMKLPKNYDYDLLMSKLDDYDVEINKDMRKIDILMAEKK
jgi:hypothetical protein